MHSARRELDDNDKVTAVVRDGDPSVDVVLVRRDGDSSLNTASKARVVGVPKRPYAGRLRLSGSAWETFMVPTSS